VCFKGGNAMSNKKKQRTHNQAYYVKKRKRRNERKKYKKVTPIVEEVTVIEQTDKKTPIKILKEKKIRLSTFVAIASFALSAFSFNNKTIIDDIAQEQVEEVIEEENNIDLLSIANNPYENITIFEVSVEHTEELIKLRDEKKRIREYDDLIKEYASYFNLDQELVVDAARYITNDYNDNMDLFNNNSVEGFAISFIYNLYNNNLSYLGYTRENFLISNDMKHFLDKETELSNGYTFDDFILNVSNAIGTDGNLVLSISNYETGYQSSSQALNSNNFGGLKNSNGYMSFPSPEAGIVYQCITVQNILTNYNIQNFKELSGVYVYGNKSMSSELWYDSVQWMYNQISDEQVDFVSLSKTF
jgi:hypothetical protein